MGMKKIIPVSARNKEKEGILNFEYIES